MLRVFLLFVLIACACSQSTEVSEAPSIQPASTDTQDSLYIHLTGGFKNDSIVIEYTDIRIIESDITTGDQGLAKTIVIPGKGINRIHVSLIRPNNTYATEIINKGDNFIEVWYCKDDVLKNYSRSEPFISE